MKINEVYPDKQDFLQVLTHIANKPEILYYTGDLPPKRQPCVAIVGSRKPTTYGREVTSMLASELASKGVVIVSGLALGIDSIAHKAALEVGGITIAVLGNGLHTIYPATNRNLAKQIITSGGALLTEYKKGTEARKHFFLERNRIVSGLADAIIITEAATRSGTLNTAAHAIEQGKDVFVVPGNITSPMSQGCNALIRQGATPVTSSRDILEVIAPNLDLNQDCPVASKDPLEQQIIELITKGVRSGDEMLTVIGCSTINFSTALTMLEVNGTIRSLGANQWTLR